jgi:dienelactone hydrolase
METIGGIPVYLTGSGDRCIVVGHDAFGIHSGRTKLIADTLALKLGVTVAVPVFFASGSAGGSKVSRKLERLIHPVNEPWWGFICRLFVALFHLRTFIRDVSSLTWPSVRHSLMERVLPGLRERGATRFALLGFCWGGWMALHASAELDFVCAASCHPSVQVSVRPFPPADRPAPFHPGTARA